VACRSAYHAGLLAKYAIEHCTRLLEIELASEFRYRDPALDRSTLWWRFHSPGRPPTR
jgi:glucosamine--fructose-6-phosphate aminotransferase (isomerizing)